MQTKRRLWYCIAMLLGTALALLCAMPAYAEEVDGLSCEVKFLLDSSLVLNGEYKLNDDSISAFGLDSEYQGISALYLETPARGFDGEGWINRLRLKDGKKKIELAYKKRYAVAGDDLQSALDLARSQGLDLNDDSFEAEVDWGDSKMTLSFSYEAEVSLKDLEGITQLEQLDLQGAIDLCKENMPALEDGWAGEQWGSGLVDTATMVGPLRFKRYKGTWNDMSVTVEVWAIPLADSDEMEYVTELSFKSDSMLEAAADRELLTERLDQMGVLVHADSLKTQKILDAYIPADDSGDTPEDVDDSSEDGRQEETEEPGPDQTEEEDKPNGETETTGNEGGEENKAEEGKAGEGKDGKPEEGKSDDTGKDDKATASPSENKGQTDTKEAKENSTSTKPTTTSQNTTYARTSQNTSSNAVLPATGDDASVLILWVYATGGFALAAERIAERDACFCKANVNR